MEELLTRKMKSYGIQSIFISDELKNLFKSKQQQLDLISLAIRKLRIKPIGTVTFKNVTCSCRYKKQKLYLN
jgi:hypothetical protein